MEIVRPTLILDKETCLRNINRMVQKANDNNLFFRPHFKTHQSAEIGEWFREAGVTAITVSSLKMAEYFAENGWDDITIAIPVNIPEVYEINELACKIKLNLLVENKEAIEALHKFIKWHVGIFIKIDTGAGRTGIKASRTNQLDSLLEKISESPLLEFKGFLSHTGHTYQTNSKHEIFNRHFDAILKMKALKNNYQKDWSDLIISIGDTPSCSICNNFDGIDEIRPGNFVFYDLMQLNLGTCSLSDIAIRMACPVLAVHPSRNEVVIYGGAIHFSKDSIINIDGKPLYGRIIIKDGEDKILLDERNYLSALHQEHGILKVMPQNIRLFKPGQIIEILPVHACLTANLMREYLTTEGETIRINTF